jgi:4-amino-4-deoxy-L-arabinose transferase-like glycosyltransferase
MIRVGFLLPLLFWGLVAMTVRRSGKGWRETLLFSAVIGGVYLVAETEFLNLFRGLTAPAAAVMWALGCLWVLGWEFWFLRPAGEKAESKFPVSRRKGDGVASLLLIFILAMAGTAGVIAAWATPNTYDSMTYHLARVAHWLQNRSISPFATSCMYQNQHCPWAEWAMLQLMLLQGNDHLVAFVQWLSYGGSIVAVSLITEALGGSRRTAMLAAFIGATLPMAIYQASSTQNDEVLSFWLLCLVYGWLKAVAEPTWPRMLFCGASLGLAMLTKTLAYLYAPPFCLWLTLGLWRRGTRFAGPRLAAVALIALTLNSGYYLRNWTTSGTLLGANEDSGPGSGYANEIHTPAAIFSNALRNLGLHAPQIPDLAPQAEKLIADIHRVVGLDPADRRLTTYAPVFYLPPFPDETQAANPLHLLAFGLSFLFLLGAGRRFGREIKLLAWNVVAGAFFFCLMLKWQPFHSRLHLPLFWMMAPVLALVLQTLRFRLFTFLFAGLLLAESVSPLLDNVYHPLVGRLNLFATVPEVQRFTVRPAVRLEYEQALNILRRLGVKQLGVIGPSNNAGWEYPLFDPDRMHGSFPWRVEQIRVENSYAGLETRDVPDAVIDLREDDGTTLVSHGQSYHRILRGLVLSLYTK